MNRTPQRRGAAMVLVLAALVLGMTAAVTAARVATDAALQRRLDVCEETADDAGQGAMARIDDWLRRESAGAFAAADALEPAVPVMNSRIAAGESDVTVRVSAFDQHGMVPWGSAAKEDPFARATLDASARDSVVRSRVPDGVPPGIDLAAASSAHPRWPRHAPMPLAVFGATHGETIARASDTAAPEDASLAGLVATHVDGPPRINLNTAPVGLIEAAEQTAQRSISGAVRAARAAGHRASIAAGAGGNSGGGSGVQFVGSTDTWSFRIDVDAGPVRRSWWATFKATGDGWACVQRLRIDP